MYIEFLFHFKDTYVYFFFFPGLLFNVEVLGNFTLRDSNNAYPKTDVEFANNGLEKIAKETFEYKSPKTFRYSGNT